MENFGEHCMLGGNIYISNTLKRHLGSGGGIGKRDGSWNIQIGA